MPTFWRTRQNCIPSVEMHCVESFFKESFLSLLVMEPKKFGLLSKIFRQGCQTWFYVSTGTFWGIIYFSGKSRFFSIFFEQWIFFWPFLDFFWWAGHNCMLSVQTYFEKKNFFFRRKNFLITFGKWKGIFLAFGKKISARFHDGNLHVRKDGQNVTNAIYAFMGAVWCNFFWKNSCFSTFFGHLEIIFRFFCKKFFQTAVRIALWLSKGTFLGNCFSGKVCFSFSYKEHKPFGTLWQSFFSVVSKTAFFVSRGTMWEECICSFERNLSFFSLPYIEIVFAASGKIIWQCYQKRVLRVHRIILQKNAF